jgi:hypothetical protein
MIFNNAPFSMGVVNNPLTRSVYSAYEEEGGFPVPPSDAFIITQTGDFVITEDGNRMITE